MRGIEQLRMYSIIATGIVIVLIVGAKIWFSSPENVGKFGERRVAHRLNWLSNEYISLNDILLPTYYGTTQIDHIVVSPYGIFIIETKNYKGWIFGREHSEVWTQSLLGKKLPWGWSSKKHRLRNPIRQNAAHVRAVKAVLNEMGDFPIIPIVVFSDNATLNISAPDHIVINWRRLRSTIRSYKTEQLSHEDVQRVVDKISAANISTKESRESHIRNIRTIQHNRAATIANGKCPRCGGNLVERYGRYGSFTGCSNYPRCRFTHQ